VAVEEQLEKRTPEKYRRNAHHWLILHGRYVCKARKPECPRCVVAEICAFPAKTVLGGVPPAKKTSPAAKSRKAARAAR
jgi:endonuclease-3